MVRKANKQAGKGAREGGRAFELFSALLLGKDLFERSLEVQGERAVAGLPAV